MVLVVIPTVKYVSAEAGDFKRDFSSVMVSLAV